MVTLHANIGYFDTRYLQITNNLSDLNNAVTARSNLGLGSLAVENVDTTALTKYLQLTGGTLTGGIINSTSINPLTTLAESWIGPSTTTGIYFKGGNVGIGTTGPGKKLDVDGDIRADNFTGSDRYAFMMSG